MFAVSLNPVDAIAMFAVPLKLTPAIVRAFCKAVAVAAFPVVLPLDPVTDPAIGFVTVKLPSVPTLVSDDASTFAASVAPVSVPASAGSRVHPVDDVPEVLV